MFKLIFKINIYYLALTFSQFLIVNDSMASESCLGTEKVAQENIGKGRFIHCKRGDIISVYSVSLKEAKNTSSLLDVYLFSMRANEVESACSFDHPIIFVGETELEKTRVQWFSCVFIGKERQIRFEPNTQNNLNEISK